MSIISKIISESLITFNSNSNILSISSINVDNFAVILDLNNDEDICDFVNIIDVFENKLNSASIVSSAGSIYSFNKTISGNISCNYVGDDELGGEDSISTVTCIDTFSESDKEKVLSAFDSIRIITGISTYYYE